MLKNQRGDTLVEVMVAIAVMTVITVGALSVMNRGIGEAQNSSERSSVRTLVTGQIELLTYMRDRYMSRDASAVETARWQSVKTKAAGSTALSQPADCTSSRPDRFFIRQQADALTINDYTGANIAGAVPSIAPTPGTARGIWIEARDSGSSSTAQPYIDFVVKACWEPLAGNATQNLSSAVRLYDR